MGSTTRDNAESIRAAFASISSRYEVANHVLSAGWDWWWRAVAARAVAARRPRRILDLATGSGDLAMAIGRRLPGVEIWGLDFCAPMLERAARKGLRRLLCADALALPFADGIFGAVTVAFGLRNMASWEGAAHEARRVLEPGGVLWILDFCLPSAAVGRALYRFYLHRVLPRVAGWITGQPEAYRYLGASIEAFPSGEAMVALLRQAGYGRVWWRRLMPGVVALYGAEKLPARVE